MVRNFGRSISRREPPIAGTSGTTCPSGAASFDLISSHIALAKHGPDHAEAMRAFREKRDGSWRGY